MVDSLKGDRRKTDNTVKKGMEGDRERKIQGGTDDRDTWFEWKILGCPINNVMYRYFEEIHQLESSNRFYLVN